MYSNDPNMYAAYQNYLPMQHPEPDPVPAKKQKLSSESEGESDGESTDRETPSPNQNQPSGSGQFGIPMAQSTPLQRFNLQNAQGQVTNYAAYYGMMQQMPHATLPPMAGNGFMYPPSMFDNPPEGHSSTSSEDSGNVSLMAVKPNPYDQGDNTIQFCQVPGRLSLLGSNKKLIVTLAEIRRRINPPECLNQSILSAILRKAKNKDGGNKLNQQLKLHSITLAQGRRKSAPNTAFTALCETEALTLAKDFHDLSEKHFPYDSSVYEIFVQTKDYTDYQVKKSCYRSAFFALMEITSLLKRDRSPLMEMPLNQPLMMHPESQKEFTNFSLLTHGFGVPGHMASWTAAFKLIKAVFDAFENPQAFFERVQRPAPDWVAQIYTQGQQTQMMNYMQ